MAPPELTIPARTPEKPVFAATSRARPHGLRLAGRIAAGLAALWLVALVLGAFGLGHLPGINLPRITGGEPDAAKAPLPKPEPSRRAASATPGVREHLKLSSRYGGATAPAKPRGSEPSPHRAAVPTTAPSQSTSPGARGGSSTQAAPNPAPASSSSPATSAPTTSTSQTTTTPTGSSSTAPGSRSQATTAPGREHSTATPTPGTGNGGYSDAEHGPKPK
jgi:hypothetical protein